MSCELAVFISVKINKSAPELCSMYALHMHVGKLGYMLQGMADKIFKENKLYHKHNIGVAVLAYLNFFFKMVFVCSFIFLAEMCGSSQPKSKQSATELSRLF